MLYPRSTPDWVRLHSMKLACRVYGALHYGPDGSALFPREGCGTSSFRTLCILRGLLKQVQPGTEEGQRIPYYEGCPEPSGALQATACWLGLNGRHIRDGRHRNYISCRASATDNRCVLLILGLYRP